MHLTLLLPALFASPIYVAVKLLDIDLRQERSKPTMLRKDKS